VQRGLMPAYGTHYLKSVSCCCYCHCCLCLTPILLLCFMSCSIDRHGKLDGKVFTYDQDKEDYLDKSTP